MQRKFMIFLFICMIFIAFLLQGTLFSMLSFGGISPNLLIIMTVSIALLFGDKGGMIAGFFCGLLLDIFFGPIIGFYALVLLYLGFLTGKFNRIFYPEDMKLPLILIVLSDLTYGLVCYVLLFLLRGRFHFPYYFLHIILPEVIYTILIAIILYPLMLHIYKRFDVDDNRSDKDIV